MTGCASIELENCTKTDLIYYNVLTFCYIELCESLYKEVLKHELINAHAMCVERFAVSRKVLWTLSE